MKPIYVIMLLAVACGAQAMQKPVSPTMTRKQQEEKEKQERIERLKKRVELAPIIKEIGFENLETGHDFIPVYSAQEQKPHISFLARTYNWLMGKKA